ncbi:MAG: hypothetical protein GQ556_11280, partial [Desulfobacterales bacterium]|nr:hypothetical protein [Desulfobacterales bacterium]
KDTDIDLVFLTGDSRSTSFGFDFAKNLSTNFEIHGEMAYTPHHKKFILNEDDSTSTEEISALFYLLGLRYLSKHDITSIIEYYHNGAGYTEEELDRFFQLIFDGENSGSDELLARARELSLRGYGRPFPGRNYLYARFSQKESFGIFYFSPGLTTIINLEDKSYTITPEVVYTGFTNWEMRFRFSYLNGGESTEYGEKLNSNRLEVRFRYFF